MLKILFPIIEQFLNLNLTNPFLIFVSNLIGDNYGRYNFQQNNQQRNSSRYSF